jgi:hypothetical protein
MVGAVSTGCIACTAPALSGPTSSASSTHPLAVDAMALGRHLALTRIGLNHLTDLSTSRSAGRLMGDVAMHACGITPKHVPRRCDRDTERAAVDNVQG